MFFIVGFQQGEFSSVGNSLNRAEQYARQNFKIKNLWFSDDRLIKTLMSSSTYHDHSLQVSFPDFLLNVHSTIKEPQQPSCSMALFNNPLKVMFPSLCHHLASLLCLLSAGSHITCLNDSTQSPARIRLSLEYMSNNMVLSIHDPLALLISPCPTKRRSRSNGRVFLGRQGSGCLIRSR